VTISRVGRAACEYFGLYLGLLYFGVSCGVYSVLASLLYPVLPPRFRARFGRRGIGFVFRTFLGLMRACGLMKLDLSALEALGGQPGLVIAPNHPCLLDAVFVIAHVSDVTCIMKAQIWDNLVLGGGARMAGYIRNDSPLNMVRLSTRELREGRPLLIFPEGTRTRYGRVNEFKGGFALIAKIARAPIQTVFIETDSPFLSKGWPVLRKPRFPLVYRARLGKRFNVEGDLRAFMRQLEEYYRQELSSDPAEHAPAVLRPAASPRPGPAA
jgi:1-acyl-sn-glycerol-3-phosphate acyltransferase